MQLLLWPWGTLSFQPAGDSPWCWPYRDTVLMPQAWCWPCKEQSPSLRPDAVCGGVWSQCLRPGAGCAPLIQAQGSILQRRDAVLVCPCSPFLGDYFYFYFLKLRLYCSAQCALSQPCYLCCCNQAADALHDGTTPAHAALPRRGQQACLCKLSGCLFFQQHVWVCFVCIRLAVRARIE